VLDDRDPGSVQLRREGRRAPTRDAVGLLDQGDGDPFREGGLPRRHEIRCLDASSGPVTENESRAWLVRVVQVRARRPVRGVELADRHVSILPPPCGAGSVTVGRPMTSELSALTDDLEKRPGASLEAVRDRERDLGIQFPPDYVEFMRASNGAEGFVGGDRAYVRIDPIEEMMNEQLRETLRV
jgi:SMI1 / KNR4 family (SUKH-1)